MRIIVQLPRFRRSRHTISSVLNPGRQNDSADPRSATFILGHFADRVVVVCGDLVSASRCQVQEREHVAARDGGDERLFGVNGGRIRVRRPDHRRRGRRLNDRPAVERPRVLARVPPASKIATVALPRDCCLVL